MIRMANGRLLFRTLGARRAAVVLIPLLSLTAMKLESPPVLLSASRLLRSRLIGPGPRDGRVMAHLQRTAGHRLQGVQVARQACQHPRAPLGGLVEQDGVAVGARSGNASAASSLLSS